LKNLSFKNIKRNLYPLGNPSFDPKANEV